MQSKSVIRGCGTRHRGAVYAEVPLSSRGVPLDTFLICPPTVIDPDELRISARGVTLIERDGTTHVIDWIGREHYPNVADFIAEARRHGISRRLPRNLDFGKLTSRSRLLMVHPRAHMNNSAELRDALQREAAERAQDGRRNNVVIRASCPKDIPSHTGVGEGEMCQALFYDDVQGGDVVLDPAVPFRTVERTIGDTTYRARYRPEGVYLDYAPAIFMSVPIAQLTVIDDPDDPEGVQESLRRARESGIDVELEDE